MSQHDDPHEGHGDGAFASLPDGAFRAAVRDELRVRCAWLMTKDACLGLPAAHEQPTTPGGAIWWCDQTGDVMGPDGHIAEPVSCHDRCAARRACYEPPVRP